MYINKICLFLIFLFLLGSAFSKESGSLKELSSNCILRAAARISDLPYFVPNEITKTFSDRELASLRNKITWVYSNNTLSATEKHRKSFEIYLDARLANLPEEAQKAARKYFLNSYIKGGSKKVHATSHQTIAPDEVFDELFVLSTVAHEIEHNIHFRDFFRLDLENPENMDMMKLFYHVAFSPRSKYITETGAMKAEWEFLQIIPEDQINLSISRIKNSSLSKSEKKFYLFKLNSSRLSLRNYLENQRGHLRYDGISGLIDPPLMNILFIGTAAYFTFCKIRRTIPICPDTKAKITSP